MSKKIFDKDATLLLREIIGSFVSGQSNLFEARGLPIGNLTSQLFANVYMNELDQFVKHELKIKSYARYTDDFVIISQDKNYLAELLWQIESFLRDELGLELHPNKIGIRKARQGIDFLGYVILPHCRVLRAKTKRRMFRKLRERVAQVENGIIDWGKFNQSLQSYFGVLSHANAHRLRERLNCEISAHPV